MKDALLYIAGSNRFKVARVVALLNLFVAAFSGYLYDKPREREQSDVTKNDVAAIGNKKRGLR